LPPLPPPPPPLGGVSTLLVGVVVDLSSRAMTAEVLSSLRLPATRCFLVGRDDDDDYDD
jgi:hypothetical protein